ncbi:uncharacterized protein PFL1_00610 [Pseudozyma flocculosa PF-1]|uniref:Uncharacterized protein n=1 Tax=Pseudozyma flocculosa TaxID=84751 RepID=A0A5C3ESC4_9BASI|nr:uncharacterized protein PFL1_00610 [Pseudozyma flocculosa PF-1]EPQ32414.1 hypothetical protein PFL1_00610 [Pseudozyma flocculosa PF-1]SPO34605.1 uncharacterized protein PSFLO_00076 [Pseudozyma flocculosa]
MAPAQPPSSSSSAAIAATSSAIEPAARRHDPTSSSPPNNDDPAAAVPAVHHILLRENVVASTHHVAARLLAIAESFLFLRDGSRPLDPITWENDLCSATFYATFALCVDPASLRARRILAKCARLGGFNVVLPFSPSGSSASATVTPCHLNSSDPNDRAGAQAAIYILQQGPAATYTDPGCAREYREACHTLGRSSDASHATSAIASSSALGKRKAQGTTSDPEPHQPPQLVSIEARYESQIKTDLAFEHARCHRPAEAAATFREALQNDPWNWRALTGLCDLGTDNAFDGLLSVQHVAERYAERSQALCSPTAAPSTVLSDGEESAATSTTSARPKAGEDNSNKKAKVSDEGSSDAPEPSKIVTRASSVPRPTRAAAAGAPQAAKTASSSGDARRANGPSSDAATRPGPNPTNSRALSNARAITNQQLVASQVSQDEKPALRGVSRSRITRTTANPAISRSTGMQLRSSNARPGINGRSTTRSAAPSQASSVASATSTSTSRSANSNVSSHSGISGRRTPATSNGTAADSTSSRSVASARNASSGAAAGKAAVPASRTTAASRWATQTGNAAGARVPASAATRRAAAVEEAAQREAARLRAELAERQRIAALETARELAKWLAADLVIFGLLKQLGEAYRHLRRLDGESAVAVLVSEPRGPGAAKVAKAREAATAGGPDAVDTAKGLEGSMVATESLASSWRNTVVYQCLLGRAYNELAQYAKAETHLGLARKLNPYLLAHMDIFSLVLFQLNREVALGGLAQEMTLIEPRSAATQIVVGNAFALQRENQTALVCFQRAAAMAPDYAYAYTLAGHEAYDLGHHDQAIAYFRSGIRCDRRHWNAWAGLGRVFLAIGGHELPACQSLQQAISINPKNHVLWDLVGWTYAQIGKRRSALEAYDKAIALAPRLAVLTYLRRSELLAHEGDDEAAHGDLVSAFELAPEEATVHLLLAQSYMRMGDGSFCELEEAGGATGSGARGAGAGGGTIKASGQMRLPAQFQAEITHHLAVAVDLDPGLLKVVKALGEGWRTNPGNRIAMNPADLSNASAYEDRYMDYSDVSGEVLEDVGEQEGGVEDDDDDDEDVEEVDEEDDGEDYEGEGELLDDVGEASGAAAVAHHYHHHHR